MKIDDRIYTCELIDIYGALLTADKLEILQMFYFENMTTIEIGQEKNLTRQAISANLIKSVEKLNAFESKLNFISKKNTIINKLNAFKENKSKINIYQILDIIEEF